MNPTRICSDGECVRPVKTRGMCNMHYQRWWKSQGGPFTGVTYYKSAEESFKARTAARGGCLEWTGGKDSDGYGHMRLEGGMERAHRYAWMRVNGPIPKGMVLDHACRNRACCNVDHLRLATVKQNNENIEVRSNNTSGYQGVSWHKERNKWQAYISHHGKIQYLGLFQNAEDAAKAASAKRIELFTHNDLDRKKAA